MNQPNPNPFHPDNLRMTPEQMAAWQAGQTTTTKPTNTAKPKKPVWCKFDYTNQMKLAKESRNSLIAVQAELYRLWFKLNDKTRPIILRNKTFEKLGFHPSDKIRALKMLERAGFVRVEWRQRKSALVTVLCFQT